MNPSLSNNFFRPVQWLLSSLLLVLLPLLGWGQVVISQVYGGGGNSGATYTNDFIELFNRGTTTVNLSGWTVQYAGSTGTFTMANSTALSGTIAPGKYYLVQEAAGGGGSISLPTADATGTINIAATAGKVALANNATIITNSSSNNVVDFVGFGTGANDFETAAAPAPSATTSIVRVSSGCIDTNNNSTDFTTAALSPSAPPRNANTATNQCSNASTNVTFTPTSGPVGTSVTISGTSFLINSTVSFNGTAATSVTYNSPVSLTAVVPTGATTGTIAVANGTATATSASSFTVTAASPTTTVSTNGPLSFNTTTGTPSTSQSYTLTGSNLTANVTVTAPTGYEVSQTSATTGFASSQSVTQSSGNASATIYVRLAGTTAGTYSGNVTNTSAGATTQNVAVSGTVVGKPTGTPTIAASTLTFNSATLTLGAADGTNLLVVVRPASSTATAPTDRTTYTASTTYGAGTALGAGFVVFAATNAASVTVSGLAQNTAYAADIYIYNTGTTSGFESYGASRATATFTTPVQIASPAGLLALEENFDYASGTVLASNTATTGWREASTGINPVTTVAGNLSNINHQYPQGILAAAPAGTSTDVALATSGQDIYKPFTQPTGTTAIYMAALITVNSTQTGGDYFLHFATSASNFRGRVYVKAVSGSTTTFNFALGVGNESVPAANYNTTAYTIGATYLVVVKYENSATTGNIDAASLFVLDPTTVPVIEPTALVGPLTTGNSTSQTTLNAIGLRQGDATSAPTVTVDAMRVASGWGAVVGRPVFTSATSTVVAGDYYSLRVTGTGTVATVSTAGPGNGVTAATAVILEKQLNLDGGQVSVPAATASSPNPLLLRARNIIGDGFDVLANGGLSYVNGPVSREVVGNSSPSFPVGRNGNYRPMTLNISQAPNGTTIYTGVQTDASAYTADATVNAPLARVSRIRYFNITPNPVPAAGTFAGTIVLSFGSDDQVTDPSVASFVVAKNNGAGWNNISRSNNSTTTLTSATFADFSNFALASTDPDPTINPLPVTLTSFTATRAATGVQLAWATASEKNSDFFEVQRSLDGSTFASVAKVAAHGTTTQSHRYASLDAAAPAAQLYYRLRQVDLDGTVAYSPVVTVAATNGATAEFALVPNPARERVSFLTAAPTAYTVHNTLGQLVRSGTTVAGPNELLVGELPAGVYFFELHGDAGRLVRRLVKE